MSNWKAMAVLGCAAMLFATELEAQAARIRVRCATSPTRSKISIDGRRLRAGNYTAVAESGPNQATAPAQAAVRHEVEFDFDSNPNDIQAGATAIDRDFIQNNQVVGKILDSLGAVVVQHSATCSVR
jgi:hypothetical protein